MKKISATKPIPQNKTFKQKTGRVSKRINFKNTCPVKK
jgi:hypothetical protein